MPDDPAGPDTTAAEAAEAPTPLRDRGHEEPAASATSRSRGQHPTTDRRPVAATSPASSRWWAPVMRRSPTRPPRPAARG